MVLSKKYPIILAERLELSNEEQRFAGDFEEFVNLLAVCEYPIEFYNGEIWIKEIATNNHEHIVANFLGGLGRIFKGNRVFRRYGSNRHVYLEKAKCAYSPDLSIVKGTPDIFEYSKGKTANKNPWLVVKILSNSTRQKDLGLENPRTKENSIF